MLAGDLREPKRVFFRKSSINTAPYFELCTMTAEGKCILGTEWDSGLRQKMYFTQAASISASVDLALKTDHFREVSKELRTVAYTL